MTTQTSYSERIAPPGPGTIAGNMDNARVATGICESAAPGIPFGRAVQVGTLSDQGRLLGAADLTAFRGISIRDITLRGDVASASLDHYLPPNSMGVLESGEIWVEPSVAVAITDPVHFDATTGIFKASGGVGPIVGAKWKTSCGVGGRAIVQLP
jgi:hypothetical protein